VINVENSSVFGCWFLFIYFYCITSGGLCILAQVFDWGKLHFCNCEPGRIIHGELKQNFLDDFDDKRQLKMTKAAKRKGKTYIVYL